MKEKYISFKKEILIIYVVFNIHQLIIYWEFEGSEISKVNCPPSFFLSFHSFSPWNFLSLVTPSQSRLVLAEAQSGNIYCILTDSFIEVVSNLWFVHRWSKKASDVVRSQVQSLSSQIKYTPAKIMQHLVLFHILS